MNHAFLIMAHDSPELLQRIVNRLKAPNHYIFIHLDIKSKDRRVSGGYLSDKERVSVNWGGYSQIRAELALIRNALEVSIQPLFRWSKI